MNGDGIYGKCLQNKSTPRVPPLKSMERQSAKFELLLSDNQDGGYSSSAETLDDGDREATGDFIMFAHQDMWLGTNTWLEGAENMPGRLT